jgi:CheY-like chemotaxis protein
MISLRVLIIEDNTLVSMMLSAMLAGMGHHVCASATSEAQAVNAAIRYRPDLMIVDAALGQGGSGISAVEEILCAGPVAHVFVSGDPGTIQARRPGAVVVRKPFREAELVSAIEIALEAAANC